MLRNTNRIMFRFSQTLDSDAQTRQIPLASLPGRINLPSSRGSRSGNNIFQQKFRGRRNGFRRQRPCGACYRITQQNAPGLAQIFFPRTQYIGDGHAPISIETPNLFAPGKQRFARIIRQLQGSPAHHKTVNLTKPAVEAGRSRTAKIPAIHRRSIPHPPVCRSNNARNRSNP